MKPKIIIEVEGGVILNITSTEPLGDIVVVDHDEEQVGIMPSIDLISNDKFSEQIDIITDEWEE